MGYEYENFPRWVVNIFFLSQTDLTRTGIISNYYNEMFEAEIVSFYVSTATFFLLHCDEWDRVVALPRHKFVTGATLLQLVIMLFTRVVDRRYDSRSVQITEYSSLLHAILISILKDFML